MALTTFGLRSARKALSSVSLIGPRDSRTKRGGRAIAGSRPVWLCVLVGYWPPAAATVSGFGETVVSVVSSSVAL